MKAGTWKAHVQEKYAMRAALTVTSNGANVPQNVRFFKRQREDDGCCLQVNDYEDEEYIGNITIGTPGQTFQVGLDVFLQML